MTYVPSIPFGDQRRLRGNGLKDREKGERPQTGDLYYLIGYFIDAEKTGDLWRDISRHDEMILLCMLLANPYTVPTTLRYAFEKMSTP